MSAWLTHVKKVWNVGKRKQKGYSYKHAMVDAKKTYKKAGKKGKKKTDEPEGGALRRRVKKKRSMKILQV